MILCFNRFENQRIISNITILLERSLIDDYIIQPGCNIILQN